jgi:hypothetical protein
MSINSLTQRIKSALTGDLSSLVKEAIEQTKGITGDANGAYCIEVEPGYERMILDVRNSLKAEGYRFNLEKEHESYLFTIYGDLKRWILKLEAQNSPLLKDMDIEIF